MQLLPYSRFTLKTHEPLPTVIDQLNSHIEAPKPFRWTLSRNHAPYTGTISSDGFEIRRIIHYRNSFLPKIRGRFESGSQGTVIHITMRLHPLSSRTKENGTVLIFVNRPQTLTIPHSPFPIP